MTTVLLSEKVNAVTWTQHTTMISLYLTVSTILLAICAAEDLASAASDTQTKDLLMKGAKPMEQDVYLCSAYPVTDLNSYIYKFEAVANASTAHHILMYGCNDEPFSQEPVWNCHAICKSGRTTILFSWAKNAPPTVLPKGVGLKIGQQTSILTIVLQVHYARSFEANEPSDHSGVRIYTTQQTQPYLAGIFLLSSNSFVIPPGHPVFYVDTSCRFTKEKSIFPIFYRTHTHSLGTVVTGYQFNDSYHEIGKGNPQRPQAFYPVKDRIEVKQGDYLAARCTYDSTSKSTSVNVGFTSSDEMCNFYIMFYTDNSVEDPYGECGWNGNPELTGSNFPADVSVPLSLNPVLEEEATGHHHHEGKDEVTDSGQDGEEIHFDHILEYNASWPGEKIELGQIAGVATDRDGNVYISHRASRKWTKQLFSLDNDFLYQESPIPEDVIVVLDSQGKLVRKFGAGQYFLPHGITVDNSGNIWLTDVAMHQVFKIPRGETKPSLVLGQKFKHGKEVSSFCQPTDVAVLSSGEFFVSDGYCNGRVLKFSKEGTLMTAWGERSVVTGSSPPAGTFDIPHSITVSEENQLVCVADKDNGRVQCFDLDGNFKHMIKHPQFGPKVLAIENCPLHGGVLYAVNGPAYGGPRDFTVQGFTLDIKTGQLLEMWNLPQLLKNPHDVCVHPVSQSVYVGEFEPQGVRKFSRAALSGKMTESTKKQDGKIADSKLNETTTSLGRSDVKQSSTSAGNETSHGGSETEDEEFTPSVVIGCLLVIPVVLLLIIALLVRAHKSGKLKCYHRRKNRVFSLQGILGNSHKGFDALSTEDSDHDLDEEDSDREEFLTPKRIKNKT